jgi:hypothetical protein
MMWEDPIVAEIHRVREQILAEFNYDVHAYFAHLQQVAREQQARGVRYIQPPVRYGHTRPDAA